MEYKNNHEKRFFRHVASMPIIYMMIAPLLMFDIFLEIYHRICFPLYGLKYVDRRKYVKIDRHKLKYLSYLEKINCMYCGYANGLIHYASKIVALTEKYWCGIKHFDDGNFIEPKHHKSFIKYGDEKEYRLTHPKN